MSRGRRLLNAVEESAAVRWDPAAGFCANTVDSVGHILSSSVPATRGDGGSAIASALLATPLTRRNPNNQVKIAPRALYTPVGDLKMSKFSGLGMSRTHTYTSLSLTRAHSA